MVFKNHHTWITSSSTSNSWIFPSSISYYTLSIFIYYQLVKYVTYNSLNVFLHISIHIYVAITSSILLPYIIKSIYILIPLSLYYLIDFHLSLFFYFYSPMPLSCPLLFLSKLISMQIKYSILKILWNICKSQVEFWLSSFSFFFSFSIQNRS